MTDPILRADPRHSTQAARIGGGTIGAGHPIALQSMAATRAQDVEARSCPMRLLQEAGADFIRIAVDSRKDVETLARVAGSAARP